MDRHVILGEEIVFSPEQELFCILKTGDQRAGQAVLSKFAEWYLECQDIETVLEKYLDAATSLILEYSSVPQFNQLKKFRMYDVGKKEFQEKCIDWECVVEAYGRIAEQYDEIIAQQEAEHEYREMRKAARGKIVGGGFGIGGALKGMATAGLMNAAAGAIHSIGNSIGNANSDMEAENLKKALYNDVDTFVVLLAGIQANMSKNFDLYINFMNQRSGGLLCMEFDEDKSEALFENAISIPKERNFLLAEAFRANPWNSDLYEYIFRNFPEERENIVEIGQAYGIDLKDSIEGSQEDVDADEMQE